MSGEALMLWLAVAAAAVVLTAVVVKLRRDDRELQRSLDEIHKKWEEQREEIYRRGLERK